MYTVKTSNHFDTLSALDENDEHDDKYCEEYENAHETVNSSFKSNQQSGQNYKIQVHFSEPKQKIKKRKKLYANIPRFQKQSPKQRHPGVSEIDRSGDSNEFYKSDYSPPYHDTYNQRFAETFNHNRYQHMRPQRDNGYIFHDNNRGMKGYGTALYSLEQQQYIQMINFYWFNCQRLLQTYNQTYGCRRPTY